MTHKVRGITGPYHAYIPTVFIIQYNHGRERRGEKSVYAGRPAVVLNLNKHSTINQQEQTTTQLILQHRRDIIFIQK